MLSIPTPFNWFLLSFLLYLPSYPYVVAFDMHKPLITLAESHWRSAATSHAATVRRMLQPGLLPAPNNQRSHDDWTGLDPQHPIFNFLIEYYGIKGSRGTRRLARWSPDPALLLRHKNNNDQQTEHKSTPTLNDNVYQAAMQASSGQGGIFLQNAQPHDLGGTLHLRGAIPVPMVNNEDKLYGILYNPALFYNNNPQENQEQLLNKIAPFQWYKAILETTLQSEPILHCHGLHEWAMQYHPPGSPPPPSAKYQQHLPLRVSTDVINQTVQRRGISCTHVDALRFFAPAAGPLNHHGAQLQRIDQLRLEQKACVHAHMDLLKISLKIQAFIDPNLVAHALELALEARMLDIEASPYDVSAYGAGAVPVETKEGRALYRERQVALMEQAQPVRIRLLEAYETFLRLAFDPELLKASSVVRSKPKGRLLERDEIQMEFAGKERFAKAEPGGLPWRRNLIDSK